MPPSDDQDLPEYLRRVDSFFSGKSQTTMYLQLEKRGWTPEDPDTLADEDLNRSLTNLIWALGDLQTYIEYTDHVSDRDLYTALLAFCDEPGMCFVGIPGAGYHWSPIGSWGEEDVEIWLRYYASEEERAEHVSEYPTWPIPPRETPLYPRPWLPQQVFLPADFDDEMSYEQEGD